MNFTNLQAELESALYDHHVAGASIAVFYQGKLTTASAGVANVTTGMEITDDTLMHIGSIAKIFTTTLVMQLVDQGCIDLDNPILQHLPDLKLKDRAALQRVTIRMLLNHTSGIDATMLPDQGHDEETIEKAVSRFAQSGQIHEPGTDYSYCNGAFVIAGYLAQQITGRSWYDLIKEKIYAPLGMQHAVTLPEEALLYSASVGHHLNQITNSQVRTSFCLQPISFSPGGTTLMMSARDLVTFARAHIANGLGANGMRILSTVSAENMRKQTVVCKNKGFAEGVGLGWMLFGNGVIGHGGGAPGVSSMLYVFPEKEFAAAILTNSAHGKGLTNYFMGPWLKEVGGDISLLGASFDVGPEESRENIDFRPYVGTYENIAERYKVSVLPDGELGVSLQLKFPIYDGTTTEPTEELPLTPLGSDEFRVRSAEQHPGGTMMTLSLRMLAFKNADADGRMQHLRVSGTWLYRRTT